MWSDHCDFLNLAQFCSNQRKKIVVVLQLHDRVPGRVQGQLLMGGESMTDAHGIPWTKVRAVGKLLRHEYYRIDIGRVWLMVEDDLLRSRKPFKRH
jgi:uncharacterized protein with HEPN domain